MFAARSLREILSQELWLWVEKLRLDVFWAWLENSYASLSESHRLALGLCIIATGLLIVLLSYLRRRRPTQADLVRKVGARLAAVEETAAEPAPGGGDAGTMQDGAPILAGTRPQAFLVSEEPPLARVSLQPEMVRIGRHEENDVRFGHKTVHRYHAVVHHTADGEFIIKDLSGANGNGVYVNGARVGERPLAPGDLVELGAIRLRFEARHA